MGLGRAPAAEGRVRPVGIVVADPPAGPARASLPVSKAWRYMHSYFTDRQGRAIDRTAGRRWACP